MSFMKKLKRSKQEAKQVPRELKEIQDEYNKLTSRAGTAQYQAYVLKRDLEYINSRLIEVNNEAAARQKLDKETADKQATTSGNQQASNQ